MKKIDSKPAPSSLEPAAHSADNRSSLSSASHGPIQLRLGSGIDLNSKTAFLNSNKKISAQREISSAIANNPRSRRQQSISQKLSQSNNHSERVDSTAIAQLAAEVEPLQLEPQVTENKLRAEKQAIVGAGSFTEIANVIDRSSSTKKEEPIIRLRNTERGIARAREYFQANNMEAQEKKFITERKDDALSDQRDGISNKIEAVLSDNSPSGAMNYDKAQKAATFGPHQDTVLAPELLTPQDARETINIAKSKGGLAKLVALSWEPMHEDLKGLWIEAYGGDRSKAEYNWIQQSKSAGTLVTEPNNTGLVDKDKFTEYRNLATAFPNDLTGCMGFVNDYNDLTMAKAIEDFGLDANLYRNGGYIIKIPADQVAEAVDNAEREGGSVGKATVFSSLIFSEFNYIVEDRHFNTTESGDKEKNPNAKQNSGIKARDPGSGIELGKGEVVVKGFKAADFFKESPKVIL